MKIVFPFLALSCVSLSALERFNRTLEAVYLRFYNSHDAYRFSVVENDAATPSYSDVTFHDTPYEPTWGIQGAISYKADYCDLISKFSGLFFKNRFHPRTQMYPGIGYENNYSLAFTNQYFSDTDFVLHPTSTQEYKGDSPTQFGNVNGIMVDQTFDHAFNSLDLTVAPQFVFNKLLTLRPVIGLGGLITNFKNSYHKYVQQGNNPLSDPSNLGLLVQTNYQTYAKFNAIGPEAGLDMLIHLTSRVYLDLNASFRWLWGHKHSIVKESFKYNLSGAVVNNKGSLKRNATVCQSDYIFNAKFCVETPINRKRHSLGMSLGYKFEMLPKFFSLPINAQDQPDEGVDFMLQGLMTGIFYKF